MDLTPYVERLRRDLAAAAGIGGDQARDLAGRLAAALDSAARIALLEALSAAAEEITRDLAPGAVEVRLRCGEPGFVVMTPPPPGPRDAPRDTPPAPPPPAPEEDGGTSRLSLRVPEQLKPRIEAAAAHEGLSVNAWLVRAITAALDGGAPGPRPAAQTGRRLTGWAR
ncbi:toxin-antitoxin system HicB family antitoxin [Bailinhaonella thermotolerans]|uniref:Toxin-antitoxin system HicB family antitoxin n=1 Tax=Bailinhaonella thermotolerans TaxID=1070861 RepID=A0A3A4AMV4_9ACTN|nr:toxin-antitoxin system HicB family antitoxin [Bailinhaonella thermotolerans]RJL27143.1 toxin-antitoxin system HicB family antitoxin [Bailinhaonella thermotolerans]